MKLGIGITTYNRQAHCSKLARQIAEATPRAVICVSDDGSADRIHDLPDGTIYLHNANGGVARNKNRVIHRLFSIEQCDVILLLDDDAEIVYPDWEFPFVHLAQKLGHTNIIFPDMDIVQCGYGYVTSELSGMCMSISRTAYEATGYMDSRFGRYGYEHVEYTRRMIRNGYGGSMLPSGEFLYSGWPMIGITSASYIPTTTPDGASEYDTDIFRLTANDAGFKFPWRSNEDRMEFVKECMSDA